MKRRNTPPELLCSSSASDLIRKETARFAGLVLVNARTADKALRDFRRTGDLFAAIGGGVGTHTPAGQITFSAGRLIACEYYQWVTADHTTQTVVDKAVADIEKRRGPGMPLVSTDHKGLLTLQAFAAEALRYRP